MIHASHFVSVSKQLTRLDVNIFYQIELQKFEIKLPSFDLNIWSSGRFSRSAQIVI